MAKEEYAEGIVGIFVPFTMSWLETFIPGDIMRSHPSDRYYGKKFVFVRRLSVDEGWSLQRACGGTMGELMGRSQLDPVLQLKPLCSHKHITVEKTHDPPALRNTWSKKCRRYLLLVYNGFREKRSSDTDLVGDGKNLIQFVHAKDVVQAFLLVLEKPEISENQTYFISEDRAYTYLEVYKILSGLCNMAPPRIHVPPMGLFNRLRG